MQPGVRVATMGKKEENNRGRGNSMGKMKIVLRTKYNTTDTPRTKTRER